MRACLCLRACVCGVLFTPVHVHLALRTHARAHAQAIRVQYGRQAAIAHLNNFSQSVANAVVDQWVRFWPELFVKYRDGLIVSPPPPPPAPGSKDQPPCPNTASPGYGNDWCV